MSNKIIELQGYKYVTDPTTGDRMVVNPFTGELEDVDIVISPKGTHHTTPKQQQQYKEKKEKEQAKHDKELCQSYIRNCTPKFIFVSVDLKYPLRPATLARLVYLASFMDYCGVLKTNLQRRMKRSELPGVLKLSKSEAYEFWNEVTGKYIFTDSNGNLYIDSGFAVRGSLQPGGYYQRVFIDAIQQLYINTKPSRHKYIGYIFQTLPYINAVHNVLCHNPSERERSNIKYLSVDEFCSVIGYARDHRTRLMQTFTTITFPSNGETEQLCMFIPDGHDIGRTQIYINPKVIHRAE